MAVMAGACGCHNPASSASSGDIPAGHPQGPLALGKVVGWSRQPLALSTRCKLASDAHRAVVGGPCIKAGRAGRRPEVALLVSLFPPHWLARGGLALALAFVVASPRQAG